VGERLDFSKEMKRKAHKRAKKFSPKKPKEVHHIVTKSFAKHHKLPTHLVKRDLNALALERDFHAWIHGARMTREQYEKLIPEMTELELSINDEEIEYKGFTNDDYRFLAIALLGIDERYFK
jgi:hypothetical protein